MDETKTAGVCEERIFSAFFRSNIKAVRNYLFYKYGNEEHANDIAQDAFIKLWENCRSVPFEKAKAYVYTIANNASLNLVAHQKVVLNYSKSAGKSGISEESPDYVMEHDEFGEKLKKAIANLTDSQREAFLLNRIDGKKYSEIAEMLGIGIKAVEKRISGALVSLRKEIDNI
ncbi:MAG: RNA polymerase subunit sigma-70 [Flavobacterium sp. BFFFF1]|uniref:RNA polymerase sigma factor n=1 Tax=unclassified Flavobacterium TaxID=196869 RepID=UPI000BDC9280|nr:MULTISPECIES: sigma-70 family RNA polymerase sigma factor [unclassified Flavobacterium]OYU80598.1 MAG: RNA polymerase subunit sigma-70 [Flavobacterium sp. BFFFF1]